MSAKKTSYKAAFSSPFLLRRGPKPYSHVLLPCLQARLATVKYISALAASLPKKP
jgi:hypothetical protein